MHRTFLAAAVVGLAGLASAGGPTDFVSYQGQLKDGGSPANGDYELQFELWTVANTSVIADSVTLTLNVENGLFNADLPFGDEFGALSSTTGLPESYELEIGARPAGSMDPFTVLPRQPVRNAARATYAERGTNRFTVGDVNGGRLQVTDSIGTANFVVEPDVDDEGIFIAATGRDGFMSFDGTFGTTGPRVTIVGVGDSIFLEPGDPVVDNKVILPAGSVGSAEIGDEAGVASNSSSPFSFLLPATYTPLLSQTIDCPSDGFVIVNANMGSGIFDTTTGVTNRMAISLDGVTPYNNQTAVMFVRADTADSTHFSTISHSQVIPVTAGTTTVSLIAETTGTAAGYYSAPLDLTLLFVPTSYGAVARSTQAMGSDGFGASPPSGLPPHASQLGAAPVTVGPDPVPYETMLVKQRALEAQMAQLRAEMDATMREQAEANGR